ncbi:MAG TPA: hypothetical protein VE944_33445 [Nostoc sp.]|uniref:hypothetical protein n=1 Tax=Nostoc sp. TaxID=1180 RepID=UPI002D4E1FD0|nr:hypothetical protein [Nostoc sp.]HYX19170.1 hypothetical protein [Nostoc sp.]
MKKQRQEIKSPRGYKSEALVLSKLTMSTPATNGLVIVSVGFRTSLGITTFISFTANMRCGAAGTQASGTSTAARARIAAAPEPIVGACLITDTDQCDCNK